MRPPGANIRSGKLPRRAHDHNGNSIIGDSIKDLNGDSLEPYYYVQFDNDGQFTLWYGKIDDAHTINPVLGSAVWSE